ncbi:hypothetical protein HDU67_000221, partial [Dinochytrium kinnereticum]
MSRRIQSAPSVALRRFGDGGGGGMVDALMEDGTAVGAFVVESVREKAERRRLRELERSVSANAGLESWDDDFDYEAGGGGAAGGGERGREGLCIPECVNETQEAVRMDAVNVKEFALHVEDLKLIYTQLQTLTQTLTTPLPPHLLPTLQTLTRAYTPDLTQTQCLIDLGDASSSSDDPPPGSGAGAAAGITDPDRDGRVRTLMEVLGAAAGKDRGGRAGKDRGGRREGSE